MDRAISMYIKIETIKNKKEWLCRELWMERKSDRAKTNGAKGRRSEDRRMDRKSDGAKKRRSKERRINGATNEQSGGATDGQSDRAKSDRAISLYIKIETIKNKRE